MQPLASILSWKLLRSPALELAGEKYETIDDPLEILVEPPRLSVTPFVPPPEKPSLYQLSNAAFPTKWIKRKGPWTEEDLRASEFDEVDGKKLSGSGTAAVYPSKRLTSLEAHKAASVDCREPDHVIGLDFGLRRGPPPTPVAEAFMGTSES